MAKPGKYALILTVLAAMAMALYKGLSPTEVEVFALKPQPFMQRIIASGSVRNDAITQIGSELTATVKKRHVYEGDQVKQGDLLIELHAEQQSAQLSKAQAALAEALHRQRPQAEALLKEAVQNLQQAQAELTRREQLLKKKLLSQEALEQAKLKVVSAQVARDNAQHSVAALKDDGSLINQLRAQVAEASAALNKTRILAPTDGVILSKNVEEGDQVQAGRTLLTFAQQGRQEIIVPVDEKLIGPLRLGQTAQVIADAFAEQLLGATVAFLAPNVDEQRGSLDVHLHLTQDAPFLRQGMTVTASIQTAYLPNALVISNHLLVDKTADQAKVWVVKQKSAELVNVRLALQTQTASVITQGLSEGDLLLANPIAKAQRINPKPIAMPSVFARYALD